MGARYSSAVSNTFVGPLPASAAETVVFTTPPMLLTVDAPQVMLFFSCDVTAGATVTRHIFLIHRGVGTSGSNIFTVNEVRAQVAGARDVASGNYFDNPGQVAAIQYTLTIQQTGATGAGAFNDGCLIAMIL